MYILSRKVWKGVFMKYELKQTSNEDENILIYYKLRSILDFALDIEEDERVRINNYVRNTIPLQIKDYKIICVDNKKIGCLLVLNYEDGVMLDEIYIEKDFRNRGIATDIIKSLIQKNKIVYLWAYKLNEPAVSLYRKLGFQIIEENENRYFMKVIKKINL